MYCPFGKIHKPRLEKEDILCIIDEDLRDYELCHKNKFGKRVSFLRQKATSGSIIHYGFMLSSYCIPITFKFKKNKVSLFMNIEFHETNFKIFYIQR